MANTPTLNLDVNDRDAYRKFIQDIRDKTGWHTVHVLPQGGFEVSPYTKRSAYVGEVRVEDWVSIVRLVHRGEPFDIAIQRYRLYLVGYKGPNKGWIVLNGESPEHVINCLNASFPVLDKDGNKIPPHLATLGTSYDSSENKCGIPRKYLKLNIESLITAVRGLTDAYLDIDNSIRVPIFVLTFIQMLPESARIEPMLSFVCEHYTHNDLTTPDLPARLITMQGSWTRVSRAVACTTYGLPFREIMLKTGRVLRDVEEATAMFPYVRGMTLDELERE